VVKVSAQVIFDPAEVRTVALVESLEDVELRQLLVICCFEVPAKHVQQKFKLVDFVAGAQFKIDFLQDFEELDADATLTAVAAAHKSVQEMDRSVLSLTEGGREPLNHVKEDLRVA
jgi:hypothetical protein